MSAIGHTICTSTVHLLLRHGGLVLRILLELLELPDEVLKVHELRVVVGDIGGLQLLVSLSKILDIILDDENTKVRQGG